MKVNFIGDNYMDNDKSYMGLGMKKLYLLSQEGILSKGVSPAD